VLFRSIGNNVTQGSATYSAKERFSHYIVKGQSAGSDTVDGEAARGAKFELRDSNITRYRPLIVVAEGQSNTATARERAAWERTTRAANSIQLNYTVPGWASGLSGALWKPNTLVPVTDVLLGIAGDFLISEVSYEISDSGSITTMRLAPPDAFKPEPNEADTKTKNKTSESVDAWSDA
jgi:prophage tail gpP-like protein